MSLWHIVGIDPGLVHTGVVRLIIGEGELKVSHALVDGLDEQAVAAWINSYGTEPDHIFIERYDPRQHFSSDGRMVQGEAALKKELKKAVLIRNLGIKTIVTTPVLNLMGLWNFSTPSHHQDLRSAARIAVLGMLKDDELNSVMADLVRAALDGNPWVVKDLGGGALHGINTANTGRD